jgi:hypothetical protein
LRYRCCSGNPTYLALRADRSGIQIQPQIAPGFPVALNHGAGSLAAGIPLIHPRPDAIGADHFDIGREEFHEVVELGQVAVSVAILEGLQQCRNFLLRDHFFSPCVYWAIIPYLKQKLPAKEGS